MIPSQEYGLKGYLQKNLPGMKRIEAAFFDFNHEVGAYVETEFGEKFAVRQKLEEPATISRDESKNVLRQLLFKVHGQWIPVW